MCERFWTVPSFVPKFDCLPVNCPDNEWYTSGVPFGGQTSEVAHTSAILCEIAAGYQKVYSIGGSIFRSSACTHFSKKVLSS
jgi:hypothetical protein